MDSQYEDDTGLLVEVLQVGDELLSTKGESCNTANLR